MNPRNAVNVNNANRRRSTLLAFTLAAICLQGAAVHAVITRLTPLAAIIDDADRVAFVTVDAIDESRPSLKLSITETLKGEGDNDRRPMSILLRGDSEGDPRQVLDRVKVGTQMVVFITELSDRHVGLLYSDGSWFQIVGEVVDESARWTFTHAEPYLRRTFKGSTREMREVVTAYIKERKEPPPVNPQEKPGLGEPLAAKAGDPAAPAIDVAGATDVKPAIPASQVKDGITTVPTSPGLPGKDEPMVPTGTLEGLSPWIIAGLAVVALVLVFALRKKGGG